MFKVSICVLFQFVICFVHSQHIETAEIYEDSDSSLVVVSGTLKEVGKLESIVPVDVYTAKYFKSNPGPSLFDAMQNINGVRPQVNCNVCNTGDIHINGLEGPYTLILIDGMPVVSGLSTVYGLFGIPQSLIDRVEIIKGPVSTLYGSEAVGGVINIITKKVKNTPGFSIDCSANSWGEINNDISCKFNLNKKVQSIIGINYFNYQNRIDKNNDGFTDLTLQNRFSVFNKWNIGRKNNHVFSLAARIVGENRWGGDVRWKKEFRGGDSIYGESIYTKRAELFGSYQLPFKEKLIAQFSCVSHNQNSFYGITKFNAQQYSIFTQLAWYKSMGNNDFLLGIGQRFSHYDDNTPITAKLDNMNQITGNMPVLIYLPGIFIQDEMKFKKNHQLLFGLRYDYQKIHGNIITPRLNYKWNSTNKKNVIRMSIGNGFRVTNVFTEDHAALTGARKVEFVSTLKPEQSWNGTINFSKQLINKKGNYVLLDGNIFYTHFKNKIIADYETDPNKILYNNLLGYAVSKGASLNIELTLKSRFKAIIGATFLNVYKVENKIKIQQLFSEKFSAVWNITYVIKKIKLTLDYTGNIYGPMRLPLLGELDPRKEYSPWWSIQNMQFTKKISGNFELYFGIKNLLNWTPSKNNPFIIARSNDPFDKQVQFDSNGKVIPTANNPYALSFDPTYVYGTNQGIRVFAGVRWVVR